MPVARDEEMYPQACELWKQTNKKLRELSQHKDENTGLFQTCLVKALRIYANIAPENKPFLIPFSSAPKDIRISSDILHK